TWRVDSREAFPGVVAIRRQLTASATGNDQVLPPIAVQIEPGDAGAELTQAIRQKRLPREIIELFLVMFVSQQLAGLLEYRPRFGARSFLETQPLSPGPRSVLSSGLVDFVNAIRPAIPRNASLAAAPNHFDGQIARIAGGKDPHRIIPRHISAAADNFLALRHRPARHFDFRSDSLGVGCFAPQTNSQPGSNRFIAI